MKITSFKVISLIPLLASMVFSQLTSETESDERMPYYILEELPANTLIGNVAIDAKLTDKYDKSELQLLRYSLLNQANSATEIVHFFDIEEKSGIVKTSVKIDRDFICAHQITCYVFLDVAVGPADYFQVIKIKVDILDVNDHTPAFPEQEIKKYVSEATAPGTYISLPTAIDPDSEAYSIQMYELVSSSHNFKLKETKSVDGSSDLRLYINGKLDREEADIYQFTVYAHDGGQPPKSGSVLVQIEIQDANDNDPKFENATYEVFVLENVPTGTTIGRVLASDLDIGSNGELVYGFSERTERSYGHIFAIRNQTGAIYLLEELDFEKGTTYLLVVTAQDGGLDSRPAHATVIVRVEDSNDNAPLITVNTLTTTGVAQVAESSEIGTFVAHVSVLDEDNGDNGDIQCALKHPLFQLEKLYQTQYKIVTAAKLDYEKTYEYNILLECTDQARSPKTSTAIVKVEVLDSNDHAPKFTKQSYLARIMENNYVSDVILRVNATDVDQGINGQVKYKIGPESETLFKINPTRGELSASVIFDREKLEEIAFKVIAYDQGSPSLSATATVTLYILDQNDEPPKFSQESYVFGTFENQSPVTEVGEVRAMDADTAPYSDFVFLFAEEKGEAVDTFKIDPQTGKIHTRKSLDRESQVSYYLTVVAQSTAGSFPPMSSTASLTIYVADQNDNTPVIDWPTEQNNSISISNLVPAGHTILEIIAHDDDIGVNSKLNFEISGGNEEELFDIDPISGIMEVRGQLDVYDYQLFPITVSVQDSGKPPLNSKVNIRVIVNNSIEYIPPQRVIYTNNNVTIIISLTSASLILLFLLVIAIVLIRRQTKDKQGNPFPFVGDQTKKTRTESQKMLTPREDCPDGAAMIVGGAVETPDRSHGGGCTEGDSRHRGTNNQLDNDAVSVSNNSSEPHYPAQNQYVDMAEILSRLPQNTGGATIHPRKESPPDPAYHSDPCYANTINETKARTMPKNHAYGENIYNPNSPDGNSICSCATESSLSDKKLINTIA